MLDPRLTMVHPDSLGGEEDFGPNSDHEKRHIQTPAHTQRIAPSGLQLCSLKNGYRPSFVFNASVTLTHMPILLNGLSKHI